jgi:DNA-binding transcriptional LysR family regulator
MRFTLRQIEYFIAAGETGSITAASERIAISQPSISTAISHLEQELGVQLFVRHHAQGLSLTPVGHTLLRESKRLVQQAEGLYAVASEASDQIRGQLLVGCFVTLAPMLMPELSHSFAAAFPGAEIRHIENSQESLLDGLRRADVDVAITYDLGIPDGVAFTPLASLPPHIVVGEAHPFARRPSVSLQELVDEPLILLDLPISREYFIALFMTEGLQPRIHSRSAHQEVVRTMVANGYGYTLANVRPRSDMALDGRRVVRVRLAGEHRPVTIGLATLQQLRKSRLLRSFESHCHSFISDAYIPGMDAPAADYPARRRALG